MADDGRRYKKYPQVGPKKKSKIIEQVRDTIMTILANYKYTDDEKRVKLDNFCEHLVNELELTTVKAYTMYVNKSVKKVGIDFIYNEPAEPEIETIVIEHPDRHRSPDLKLHYVTDQVGQILLGKNMTYGEDGCLGHRNNLLKASKYKHLIIHIPYKYDVVKNMFEYVKMVNLLNWWTSQWKNKYGCEYEFIYP